jgi:hypothetical protein
MKRRSWKVWVAGIALMQLLVIEIDAVLLWPEPPSEAEKWAERIRGGMSDADRVALFRHCCGGGGTLNSFVNLYSFQDRSELVIGGMRGSDEMEEMQSVRATPAHPIPPLTRLHRALARVFPFLAD